MLIAPRMKSEFCKMLDHPLSLWKAAFLYTPHFAQHPQEPTHLSVFPMCVQIMLHRMPFLAPAFLSSWNQTFLPIVFTQLIPLYPFGDVIP